ncbi:hypothetical protein, partial [Pseudomonas sp. GW460-13]|uniref:hypothetical protein n=1 Tax=Pseudomonas sp. GW460-13 TaxID=2070590 RepID=UPI000CC299C1
AFSKDNARLALGQIEADRRIAEPFNETLDALDEALSDFVEMLESQAERAESLQQCHRRALELANKLAAWRADAAPAPAPQPPEGEGEAAPAVPAGPETVRWVEVFSHT